MPKIAKPKDPKKVKSNTMELDVGMRLAKGTHINDVDLPEYLKITHRTGIDMVDKLFGGEGITPTTAYLLTGASGCGKTTLALQMLDAWTRLGNIGLFNTNEEAAVQVRKTVVRLGLQSGFFIGQDRLVPEAIKHAEFLAKKFPNKRIMMINDSLQTLDDGFYPNGGTNTNTQVRVTAQLTRWAKETHNIAGIIGQVNKNGEFAGKNMVKHAVDVHLHQFFDKAKKSDTFGERIIINEKNRFGPAGCEIVFGIDGRRGVYEKEGFGGNNLYENIETVEQDDE